MKYSLVIKARSKVEAQKEARKRGVTLDIVDKVPKHDEVIGTAQVKSTAVLQRWYNEDTGAQPPYPYGSLLLFSKVRQLKARRREHAIPTNDQ